MGVRHRDIRSLLLLLDSTHLITKVTGSQKSSKLQKSWLVVSNSFILDDILLFGNRITNSHSS